MVVLIFLCKVMNNEGIVCLVLMLVVWSGKICVYSECILNFLPVFICLEWYKMCFRNFLGIIII